LVFQSLYPIDLILNLGQFRFPILNIIINILQHMFTKLITIIVTFLDLIFSIP
jgi:hypothetical protein